MVDAPVEMPRPVFGGFGNLDAADYRDMVDPVALACEEKHLQTIVLLPAMIRALFLEYVVYYHPILPIVDVLKGPERIYKLCPALFWVIMFTLLRRFDDNKLLLIEMLPYVKGVLAEIMISPVSRYNPTEEDEPIMNALSVFAVQAFVIYSYWPPITSSLSADSAYSTVGVAQIQAIRIGLHSPTTAVKTPHQVAMAQENAKTWVMCNIAMQTIATAFGFPAFVLFDTAACRPGAGMPALVRHMMEIARFEAQMSTTLNSNARDLHGLVAAEERLPLLKVLLARLDEIEMGMVSGTPVADNFRLLQVYSARVHLLAYYFMDTARIAQLELHKGLIRLFNAAVTLITHTKKAHGRDHRFVRYLPSVYILNIWQAACIIGKLAHSPIKRAIDLATGRQCYATAISLAARASILKHDIAHRLSGIMRSMWHLFRSLDDSNLATVGITVRSRMSASVFFDCMHLLRDQVGMLKLNSRTEPENAIADDDFEDEDDVREDIHDAASDDDKPTPGSSSSLGRRRPRSLSNTANAELKARKIIRTIPLDPQPITAKRSSIFKVVNQSLDSSPALSTPSQVSPGREHTQGGGVSGGGVNGRHQGGNLGGGHVGGHEIPVTGDLGKAMHGPIGLEQMGVVSTPPMVTPTYKNLPLQNVHTSHLDESPLGLENLELADFDVNNDMLWKDLDLVMNDFGFHTQF